MLFSKICKAWCTIMRMLFNIFYLSQAVVAHVSGHDLQICEYYLINGIYYMLFSSMCQAWLQLHEYYLIYGTITCCCHLCIRTWFTIMWILFNLWDLLHANWMKGVIGNYANIVSLWNLTHTLFSYMCVCLANTIESRHFVKWILGF